MQPVFASSDPNIRADESPSWEHGKDNCAGYVKSELQGRIAAQLLRRCQRRPQKGRHSHVDDERVEHEDVEADAAFDDDLCCGLFRSRERKWRVVHCRSCGSQEYTQAG